MRVALACGHLLRGSPTALAITRQILRDVPTMEEDDALEWTASLSAQMFASEDAREGRDAFLARRAASWVREVHPDGCNPVSP